MTEINDEDLFDQLSRAILGTDDEIKDVLTRLGLEVDLQRASEVLGDGGVFPCANCGTWAYLDDEYCDDCTEILEENGEF